MCRVVQTIEQPGNCGRMPRVTQRQLEGTADAKACGVYKGRMATIDPAKIKQTKADGMGPSAIEGAKNWSGICVSSARS
jgi:hypothetical protein